MKLGAFKYKAADAYLAAYPCLQKANTTQFNYGGTTGYATIVGGDLFWYYPGCPVKFRTPSGSTGLVIDTLYFLQRQSLGIYSLHTSVAGALENTGFAPLTSNGGGTNYIFPAFLIDVAKSNNALYNTKMSDQNAFIETNYMGSNAESGSQAQNFTLPDGLLLASFNPANQSLFISTKVKGNAPSVNKRAVFGNGGVGTSQPGWSVYSDGIDPTKVRVGFTDAVNVSTSALSGAVVFNGTEHTVALAIDGPQKTATLYVDGVRDVTINITADIVNLNPFCLGGYGANSLSAGLRFVHILAFNGSLPIRTPKVARHLAVNSSRVLLNEHFI